LFANLSHRLETVLTGCFFAAMLGGLPFLYRVRQPMSAVIDAVEHAAHHLGLLSQVLVRLEKEQFRSPLLRARRASLDSEGSPPSARLARLDRIMEWGPRVRRWLEAAGEFEALCSLASHAFEHPEDAFPEIVADGPRLEAEAIGHPLIPESSLVRNDVALAGGLRLLLVSGSNMSGISTLLPTIGVNAMLAQAGGTVRATRLRLSPLAIGASIRVLDSLQGRNVPVLRRDRAAARHPQRDRRLRPGAVSARPIPARRQLARPAHRRGRATCTSRTTWRTGA
jgi:hypothetical protein